MKRRSVFLAIAGIAIIVVIGIILLLPSSGDLKTKGEEGQKALEDEFMEEMEADQEGVMSYMDVSTEEAKALIENNPDLVIIDVSPYYEDGHLPGAVWYYFGDGSLDRAIPTLDKEKSYLVYCHFDGPSIAGAQKLVDAGFTVYRLTDHFSGWRDAGYEVEY